MFNFTTTTIVNSLTYLKSGNNIVKTYTAGNYPGTANDVVRIKRDFTFEKPYVTAFRKSEGYQGKSFEMKIDPATVITAAQATSFYTNNGYVAGSLTFWIALEGSEEHLYANDWYKKGKPFSIGYHIDGNTTAKTLCDEIASNVTKYNANVYGKKLYDIIVNADDTLTIKGVDDYQRLTHMAFRMNNSVNPSADEEITLASYDAEKVQWQGVLDGVANNGTPKTGQTFTVFTPINRGVNAFGTYWYMVSNLRLPTAENTKFLKLREDETPIQGEVYDQYLITYCAPSVATPGFSIIGQGGHSETTHIFWVRHSIASQFEAAVTTILPAPTAIAAATTAPAHTVTAGNEAIADL